MTRTEYISWFDEVLAPTEPMILLVDESSLSWQLTDRSFTLGQLIAHIPMSLQFNARVLAQEAFLPSIREILVSNRRHVAMNADAATRAFRRTALLFREEVERVEESDFAVRRIQTPQKGEIPVWRFCTFVLEHHIHHLMELHLSLKVLGLSVNTRTLYVGT